MNDMSLGSVLFAFVVYLALMIAIGALYMKKTKNSSDYFLGGRGLNGWVAALSAQASDMSGWLLMGLPGSVYAFGTGQIWIAVGLFIGTVLNWVCISGRLRRYTIKANNSLTLPEFFENRFKDDKKVLLGISSVVIVIFFVVYTASALASGGKLFNIVLGVDYRVALTIGAVVILAYTFMGGFMAVCTTDFVQGLLMLVGLLTVPIIALFIVGPDNLINAIASTNPQGGVSAFLDVFGNAGKPLTFVDILSQLAWGLGYCGMPHILVRFMAVKNDKELRKSRVIAIVWVALSLFFGGIVIGVVGRGYLAPTILGTPETTSVENVFIVMIERIFTSDIAIPFIGGIFLCGILAAIMSTADSQLLVASSSVAEDIYKGIINKKADDKRVLVISRVSVVVIAIVAYVIALDPDSSIMGLVSNAWSGFGSAFGPLVVCSLFWKRTNKAGAIAGMISGALTVILWDYIPLVSGQTLGVATGIYSLLIGFFVSLIFIVIVSLATKAPSQEIVEEFEYVAANKEVAE
ncbi:MAG: sodium/proline symporter PutP [Lachnospiraceae bacterium]|nr:sodium/proline symporter PutP [Lachnospiraceae bacterium]